MREDEIPVGRAKDLRGKMFERLTPLYRTNNQNGKTMWKCECECGNLIIAEQYNLTSGHTKSCGCLSKLNLTNKRFGKLIALEPTDKRHGSQIVWKCQCDCGNVAYVDGTRLNTGITKSCGCLTSAIDLSGQRFGKLIALEPTDQRSGNFVVWKCQCDCGNIAYVSVGNLNAGHVKSCGCLSKLDLTNQRFGKLMALEPIDDRRGTSIVWKCQCDCGNITYVEATHLNTGVTKSCGCLTNAVDLTGQIFGKLTAIKSTERRVNSQVVWELQCECGNITYATVGNLKTGKKKSCGCITNALDLTEQRFGKLVAIKSTEKRNGSGSIIWECKCDCGNLAYIPAKSLSYGETNSCGCLTSRGEMIITNILQRHDIIHEVQKTFETCRFIDTNSKARFDFFVNNTYLIEFDGSQHFYANGTDWNTEEKLQKTQEHDDYKNQWCKDNNIPLIRIPYTKLNTLCIEDLLLETTKFRVV